MRASNPRKFAHLLVLCVSSLDFLLFIPPSLPDLNFFLSLPFWMCDFCYSFITMFRRGVVIFILSISSYFFWVVYVWSSPFLWRIAQRTACISYVRVRSFFFFWIIWGVNMVQFLWVLLFACFIFPRGIYSSPELLEPVLRPRTALYSAHQLTWEQQQQQQPVSPRLVDKVVEGKTRYDLG